jgi:hypothetical protein
MRNYKCLFLILLIVLSCNKKENLLNKPTVEINQNTIIVKENINEFELLEIDSLWKILKVKDGCLTGGENIKNGKFGNQGCVLTNSSEWKAFFKKEKVSLTKFLVNKLGSRDSTYTHTCPFFNATEGELAVYALQGIHKKNWFEFYEFKKYEDKLNHYSNDIRGNRDTYQGYLNDYILTNPKERKVLEIKWMNELN